jgi:DNA-binding NarL/FixJ family response regulator
MLAEFKATEAERSWSPEPSMPARAPVSVIPGKPLSARECEVVVAICEGLGVRESAHRLGISHNTVIEHLKRIYSKLGFTNQIQLVRYASRTGMIEP